MKNYQLEIKNAQGITVETHDIDAGSNQELFIKLYPFAIQLYGADMLTQLPDYDSDFDISMHLKIHEDSYHVRIKMLERYACILQEIHLVNENETVILTPYGVGFDINIQSEN